jgi:hypothetical protein
MPVHPSDPAQHDATLHRRVGGPVHPPGPHHRWIYNAEGVVDPQRAGELVSKVGAEILSSGAVELGKKSVGLPDEMRAVVRHEVLPRGELVLKLELIWNEPSDMAEHPITELLP